VDLEGNALEELDQSHKDHATEQVALLKTKIKGHQDRDDAL
jgi:sRNA-binding protein